MKKVIIILGIIVFCVVVGIGFSKEKVEIKEESVIFVNGSNISKDYIIDIDAFDDLGDSIEYVIWDHETGGFIVQIDKDSIPSNTEYVYVVAK